MDLLNWTSNKSLLDFNIHGFHTGTKFSIKTDQGIIEDAHYEGYELFGKSGTLYDVTEFKLTYQPASE